MSERKFDSTMADDQKRFVYSYRYVIHSVFKMILGYKLQEYKYPMVTKQETSHAALDRKLNVSGFSLNPSDI